MYNWNICNFEFWKLCSNEWNMQNLIEFSLNWVGVIQFEMDTCRYSSMKPHFEFFISQVFLIHNPPKINLGLYSDFLLFFVFVFVFVFFFLVFFLVWRNRPSWELFTHVENSPLLAKGCKFWAYDRRLWLLIIEWSLAYHPNCGTGHPLLRNLRGFVITQVYC